MKFTFATLCGVLYAAGVHAKAITECTDPGQVAVVVDGINR